MEAAAAKLVELEQTPPHLGVLCDPTMLWRVHAGAVDLFLVPVEGSVAVGARRPLGRIARGEAILSARPQDSFALFAHPTPGTEVESIDWKTVSSDDLACWMARLSSALGMPTDVEQDIDVFHQRTLGALIQQAREKDSRFASRLRTRIHVEQATAKVAQRALTAVLSRDAAAVPGRVTSDPLFEAARVAAQAANIELTPPAAIRGSSSKDPIEDIARASAVRVRRVALSKDWWRRDGGPFVGYLLENGQPVALLPKGSRGYELCDPAMQRRQTVNPKVAARLRTHGHSFYRHFPAEKLTFGSLLQFGLWGTRRNIATILFTGMVSGMLGLIAPVLTGILFDSVIPGTDRPQLLQIFGILVASAISLWLLRLAQDFAVLRLEGKMDAAMQAALWDRLLSLPVEFFRGYTSGDLAQRSMSIAAIREFLTGTALSAMLTGIFSIFSVGLLFHYGGPLALPAIGLIALSFLITMAAAVLQIRIQRRFAELSGRVAGLLPQLLGGIAKLRVAGAEDRAFARWAFRFAEQKRLSVQSRRLSIMLTIFFQLFQAATMILLFALLAPSSGAVSGVGLTAGSFLAFQAAFLQVLGGSSQLGSALISVLAIVPIYERAKPILETLPEVSAGKSDPGDLSGELELAHIAFRYKPELPAVLTDVSLHINPGQFVAIVGGTGSGKSTMLRLLLGFESPDAGSIFYGGQDLAGLDIQAVRKQIGTVLQQGGVMGGDLFSNIVGSSPLTMDDAWEAARMAGLDEDIRNMPMGMHTVIPDGGLGLSGGQRQRLAIARSIVHRPRILLFDEATSALDNQTQAIVMESLSRLKATRIVIAHRLSTIRDADCIFVLNRGVVEESGTYEELMARDGVFTELARRQIA